MSSNQFDTVRLLKELRQWSLDDLQTLCIFLQKEQPLLKLSYDNLAGKTSSKKAEALFLHLQRYEKFQSWAHLRRIIEEHFTFMDATFLPELTQTPLPQLASNPDRPERVPDPKPAQARLRQIPVWGWAGGGVLAVIALLLIWPWGETPPNPTPTVAATQVAVATVEEPTLQPTQELPPTVAPTQQPTAIVTPTVTPSPSPTNPPTATWTPTITPTPRPTITPSPIPPPTATLDPNVPPPNAQLSDEWVRPIDGMVMVFVPAGTFMMGSTEQEIDDAFALCNETRGSCSRSWFDDEEYREVTLEGFWIDKYEVTNAQYQLCVDDGACESSALANDSTYNGGNYPVVGVSLVDAVAYAEWVEAGLPTEEQWEYAARGEEGRIYPWGNELDGTRLNFCDVNCEYYWKDEVVDDGYQYTAPVGNYPTGASWVGALDMAGNVWEWTSSPYDSDTFVLRGGSWLNPQFSVRASYRYWNLPVNRLNLVGFRLVSPISPSPDSDSQ